MISLCMIVKNEENNLRKCLSSINNYVDEIIIIDTGSIDNTKKIARKFTDKIFDYIWDNDFAKARNFSVSKAKNDWILVLDADEIVINFDNASVLNFINEHTDCVGRIKRINIFEDKGVKKYIERINRFFNKNYYHYEGIIHEQVKNKGNFNYSMIDLNITVEHIGYQKEVVERSNKLQRNINLLNKALEENMNDPYLHYQLGKSYYMAKNYELSVMEFEKALYLIDNYSFEYVEDLIETYGYAMLNLGRYKEVLEIAKYEKYYFYSSDFNFLLGLIYMNNGLIDLSIKYFNKATQLGEGNIEGTNSYLAFYNLGVIYECLGFLEEAKKYYIKCQDYELAKNRLRIINSMKKSQ
ncbi:MAG: glycosyltransferase [Caloramator sp.]|nr:glycosyltransferase [Caloramator sp.]